MSSDRLLARHDEPRAFDQTGSEHVMAKVSDGFSARADREAPRHRAEAETRDLRKDEPHPVASFAPARKLLDDLSIDRLLGLYEAPEIERIAQSAGSFRHRRTSLVGGAGLTVTRCAM